MALAGRVIASHYALPLPMTLAHPASLHQAANEESPAIAELQSGAAFELLDDSLGWAWGYAGEERLVGYVRSGALGEQTS